MNLKYKDKIDKWYQGLVLWKFNKTDKYLEKLINKYRKKNHKWSHLGMKDDRAMGPRDF